MFLGQDVFFEFRGEAPQAVSHQGGLQYMSWGQNALKGDYKGALGSLFKGY